MDILRKLDWCARLAKKCGATGVMTGDLFHRKRVPEQDITAMIQVLGKFPGGFVYSVLGNHDTIKPGNMVGTGYEALVAAGVVKDLDIGITLDFGGLARLTGFAWRPETELAKIGAYARSINTRQGIPEIRITHGMLVDSKGPWPFEATYAGGLKNLPDLLINGHNHVPFDAGRVINLGSLCRISEAEDGPRRVLLVQVQDGKLSKKFIPVPLKENVWRDRQPEPEIDIASERVKAKIDAFVDDMAGEKSVMAIEPEALLARIPGVTKEAHAAALGYLRRARERLGA